MRVDTVVAILSNRRSPTVRRLPDRQPSCRHAAALRCRYRYLACHTPARSYAAGAEVDGGCPQHGDRLASAATFRCQSIIEFRLSSAVDLGHAVSFTEQRRLLPKSLRSEPSHALPGVSSAIVAIRRARVVIGRRRGCHRDAGNATASPTAKPPPALRGLQRSDVDASAERRRRSATRVARIAVNANDQCLSPLLRRHAGKFVLVAVQRTRRASLRPARYAKRTSRRPATMSAGKMRRADKGRRHTRKGSTRPSTCSSATGIVQALVDAPRVSSNAPDAARFEL